MLFGSAARLVVAGSALLVLTAGALGACDSDGSDRKSPPPDGGPTVTPKPTGPQGLPSAPEAPHYPNWAMDGPAGTAAAAAYESMWISLAIAGETGDPNSPMLRQWATGVALTTLINTIEKVRAEGHFFRGRPVLHPTVVDLAPPSDPRFASIRDCADGSNWSIVDADGKVLGRATEGKRITATVTRIGGTWKVSDFRLSEADAC